MKSFCHFNLFPNLIFQNFYISNIKCYSSVRPLSEKYKVNRLRNQSHDRQVSILPPFFPLLPSRSIINIMSKVVVKVDEQLNKMPGLIVPNIVSIKTVKHEEFSKRIDFIKGSPQDPMSLEECVYKFNDCADFAAKPLDKAKISKFTEMVLNLEEVKEASHMVRLLHQSDFD